MAFSPLPGLAQAVLATLVAGNVEVREMEFQLVYAKLVSPIAIGQDIADWAARVPSGQITQTAPHALD